MKVLRALAGNPLPPGTVKLEGSGVYRIRIGDYRAVYGVDSEAGAVDVRVVADRKDVYKIERRRK
jgi:mRNA interferase RelE/StbE